ncbi:methyl-accepting chemotaxis protein [Clostridium sp. C2-6-12]|uniref:methyl-accepting chemotaxis protein n=1 Tax=Clostridium sp. C2-6-12 TaxID=2698832 RepID=UPI0013685C52|nr:methyl-accepting chemotaxis protein [Clostridium sp. C2-6-12]
MKSNGVKKKTLREKYENQVNEKNNGQEKSIAKNLKIRSIKSELLFTMLSVSIVLTVVIIIGVSTILSKNYDSEINSKNEMISNLISKNVSSFMDTAYKVTEELAYNSELKTSTSEVKAGLLKGSASRNPYFELLYIQDETGMQTGRSAGALANRADRWWFIKEKESPAPFVSKSYYSVSTKNPVTSVFIPIIEDNKFKGVMASDINLSKLQELIKENSDEGSGRYSFVIDGDGVVVAHPDNEVLAQLYNYKKMTKTTGVETGNTKEEPIDLAQGYNEIIGQVMSGKAGSTKFEDKGENLYASYTPIKLEGKSDNWSVITIQKESSAKAIINKVIKATLIVGVIILLLAGIVILVVSKHISKPIIQISDLLMRASTGDFTVKSSVKAKNEIGSLSLSFNEMIGKISNLLNSTKELTKEIKDSSNILTHKSDETTNVAKEINVTVQEIAQGASNQAYAAEESAKLGDHMSQEFNQLSEKTNLMINEAINSSKAIANGIQKVDELKEKAATTVDIVEKTQENIEDLKNKSLDIEKILQALHQIAEQTNLLSLNASIEAARAGEHGKGFGVVASEIQKLSVQSAEATKNIENIILEIQNDILKSVGIMKDVRVVSEEQFTSVNEVNEAFDKIAQATDQITNAIDYMGEFVNEMNKSNNDVVNSMNNIAAISEETAACSEEVTASIQTQTEAIADVLKEAEQLKQKAELLNSEINKFRI